MSLSSSTRVDASPALVSAHCRRLRAAHRYQGSTNDCGPYVAAMIIEALTRAGVHGSVLAREIDRPRWSGFWPVVRRIPGNATFPWGLVDVLRSNGLDAWWRILAREDDLLSCLAEDNLAVPITGEWQRRWAHYAVLVAWHPELGFGFTDPGRMDSRLTWIRADLFRRAWRSFGRTVVYVRPAGSMQDNVGRGAAEWA